MFGNSGPIIYFTYQYDSSTITRMRYQYYQNTKSYGGDNVVNQFINTIAKISVKG